MEWQNKAIANLIRHIGRIENIYLQMKNLRKTMNYPDICRKTDQEG